MKLFTIFALITFSSVFADTRVFEKTQNVTRTEYPCLWRTAQCDLEEMRDDLIADCHNSGYSTCTQLSARTIQTYHNPNGICGWTTKGRCEVKVIGRN